MIWHSNQTSNWRVGTDFNAYIGMVIRLRNREDAGAARTTPQKNREMIDSSFKLSTVMIHCRESRRSGSLSSISVGRLEWIMNMKKRSGAKALRTRDGSALAK